MSKNLLEIKNLLKYYGDKLAVDDLSITVEAGKIVGLLGPNGCGKTTTMKIVAGLINDYKGTVLIEGKEPGVESRSGISYLPEKTYLSDWMKVSYAIDYFADFYADFDKNKAYEILTRFQLEGNMKLKAMSKGMQEKVQLILVMARAARLYLLDEPLSGIDPAARTTMLDIVLQNYTEGSSILLSTHLIYDVERIFDSVIMMGNGKLILSDTVDNIRETSGKSVDELFREVFKC
ncbi:MAG: ABC transporter [Clostridiales bacterium 43-6]|nr:MAG: ABC transporter [Clostridiales bacterium 43-6]